jgi:glycosyltransferase involved in cell wall biosynthesis
VDRLITRIVFSLADAFCAHCQDNADQLADTMGIDRSRIHVMPIPVYDQYCDPEVTRESARAKLGIAPDRTAFLLFGNHRDYKGTDVFLEAVAGLTEEQRARVLVMIVGQVWGEEERYERIIGERGIGDCVFRCYGYVPMHEVKYHFEATDVVALPYKHFAAQSGVGSLVLAFGKALLVTRCGGLPTLVKRPEALCDPDDVESLREGIARILDDAALLEQMATDSREIASERSWDATASRTLEIYQHVLTGHAGAEPAQPE